MEACIWARHHGQAEPTYEEFCRRRQELPWHQRIDMHRREYGRSLYKSAALHFAQRKYRKMVWRLIPAFALEPRYVLHRVLPQFRSALRSNSSCT